MKIRTRLATAGGTALAAGALLAAPFAAPASADSVSASHAAAYRAEPPVFVQSDNVDGNTVVAYNRAADGTLSQAGVYPTGGLGGVLAGSVVDHLASQGSLSYDAASRQLFAVNAGSDSITVFDVRGSDLRQRQVIGSGGSFPVSVTVHGDAVYVLNARNGGSIQGYLRIGGGLLRVPSWNRSLGLDSTLTPEFTHTPGQVAFTPDGSKLVVTTKANGNNIDVFAVNRFGAISSAPVVTPQPDAVPFAVAFDARGRLSVAEAGPSAIARFRIARDGSLTPVDLTPTGQKATCWIATTGRSTFTGNAGSATVSGYRSQHGTLTATGLTSTDAGTVDSAASSDGRYLYTQTGAAGIVDEFAINHDGTLTAIGSVTVPGGAGGEGIAAL